MGEWTDELENTEHVDNCFGHEDGHSTALCPCELRNGPRLGVTRFNWRDYFDSYGILDDPDDYAIGLGGGGGGTGSPKHENNLIGKEPTLNPATSKNILNGNKQGVRSDVDSDNGSNEIIKPANNQEPDEERFEIELQIERINTIIEEQNEFVKKAIDFITKDHCPECIKMEVPGYIGGPVGSTVRGAAGAARAAKVSKVLPSLDATGKVHGTLPKIKDLGRYSKDELQILLQELKQSVRQRIKVTSRLGRDRNHGQRQGAELDLIKAIEKHLQNR